MVRFGLLAVLVGLVVWRLARPSPRGGVLPRSDTWQRRGARAAVIGFAVLWVAAVIAIGVR